MIKIVADSHIPYVKRALEPFARIVSVAGREIGPEDVKEADALLVRTRTRCDGALLAGSRVKFIATATIGTDHIDTAYCSSHGIGVASAAGSNARGVLQWVAAALAMLSHGKGQRYDALRTKGCLPDLQYPEAAQPAEWLPRQKTLGIVGVGHVGSLVGEFAREWGFRVLCSDPPREAAESLGRREGFVPLAELASQSDIITFHTPLTREGGFPTWRLAGERFFDSLRHGAAIINSARGGVVDEYLLGHAIMTKGVAACLDTWENEPEIDGQLLEMALIATPHIAGYTVQGKANASAMAVDALARYFGLPLKGWYPAGIERGAGGNFPTAEVEYPATGAAHRPDIISWDAMCRTINDYCDLESLTAMLKSAPASFESLRESYNYRNEYF